MFKKVNSKIGEKEDISALSKPSVKLVMGQQRVKKPMRNGIGFELNALSFKL